jgi:hypothetical protein
MICQILADSLAVLKNNAQNAYNKAKPYAEQEFKKLADDALFLAGLLNNHEIDDNEFKQRLMMQKHAATNVLLTIQGIGLVAAQNTINAVIGIVSTAVQKVLGVVLPI